MLSCSQTIRSTRSIKIKLNKVKTANFNPLVLKAKITNIINITMEMV